MKQNQLLVLSALCISIAITTKAQIVSTGYGESGVYMMTTVNMNQKQLELRYESIDGSPYLTEDFRKCVLYLENGSVYRNVAVRLNIYDNNLEFQRGDTYYIFDKVDGIYKIEFSSGDIITFVENLNKDIEGFYRIEADGKYRLLSGLDVNFREGKTATNSYTENVNPQFIRVKDKLYIQLPDENLVYLKNKKSFGKEFSSDHKEFVNYAKTKKLNPGNQEDLIKIVEYMNHSLK